MSDKDAFIEFMMDCQVLRFGEFTTKSGRNSPYFINTGLYKSGRQLLKLGEFYAKKIADCFGTRGLTNLFGPAYKGIPIGTSVSMALYKNHGMDVSVSFNRKEVKSHGEGGWLLGESYGQKNSHHKIVIVEDVTTAGTSIRENLPSILNFPGAEVMGLVVSVDRMERGLNDKPALEELQDEFGIETHSLVDFNDIVDYLKNHPQLPDSEQLVQKMLEYNSRYGVTARG